MVCRGASCSSESLKYELGTSKVRLENVAGGFLIAPSPPAMLGEHGELPQYFQGEHGGMIRFGLTVTPVVVVWNGGR